MFNHLLDRIIWRAYHVPRTDAVSCLGWKNFSARSTARDCYAINATDFYCISCWSFATTRWSECFANLRQRALCHQSMSCARAAIPPLLGNAALHGWITSKVSPDIILSPKVTPMREGGSQLNFSDTDKVKEVRLSYPKASLSRLISDERGAWSNQPCPNLASNISRSFRKRQSSESIIKPLFSFLRRVRFGMPVSPHIRARVRSLRKRL